MLSSFGKPTPRNASLLIGLILLGTQTSAFAHVGVHSTAEGFVSGFSHPLSGLDHILAMLAVGLWAAQAGRSGKWLMLVFPMMMLLGAGLGLHGLAIPGVEIGICLSVLMLGLLVTAAVRLPLWAGSLLLTVFALLHGQAHATELPPGSDSVRYMAGFVLATALLHGIGFFQARFAAARLAMAGKLIRGCGALISVAGAYLLAGQL